MLPPPPPQEEVVSDVPVEVPPPVEPAAGVTYTGTVHFMELIGGGGGGKGESKGSDRWAVRAERAAAQRAI